MASAEVEASPLPEDVLPTELQVYQHCLHLEQVKVKSGEWNKNTPLTTKAKCVAQSISEQWGKTSIPHNDWSGRKTNRVERLITSVRNFKKNFKKEKDVDIEVKFGKLFDIARCQCSGHCTCPLEDQVPPNWMQFLEDQRGERQMVGVLCSRKLSLRGAREREEEDRKRKAEIEKREELVAKKKKQEEKNQKELEDQFKMVNLDEMEMMSDGESELDSNDEWQDVEEDNKEKEKKKRNRKALPIISAGCDRFRLSDRVGAYIANCTLAEFGIITAENTFHLIDPTKLRRQRLFWGKATAGKKKTQAKMLPGLYTDGLRSSTLVRRTKVTKVATGKRGRGATREVSTVSNEVEIKDNFPILGMPGAEYVTHVTPEDGTGLTLAKELESVVRQYEMPIKVIGMDGCPVNTGAHSGAIRTLELLLGHTLQWMICGLHLNELLWWHILLSADGGTSGPDRLSGPIGSLLHEDVWTQPVAKFAPIPGKVPTVPEEVVTKLSRDQKLAYRYSHAVQSGIMPDDLVNQTIGPLVKSRWITCGVRVLCVYTRTKKPSKGLVRLVKVVLNLYFPGWFRYRHHSHIQDGSRNFYYLVTLTCDLSEADDRMTAQEVLSRNSFWAHPENVTISMMGDEDREVRRQAVNWVKRARAEFDPTNHPRQFFTPKVDFSATSYTKMVDWDSLPCTEPPLTSDMTEAELDQVVEKPHKFEAFPNHTQQVEAMVRVVDQTATKRATHEARDGLIHQLMESRKLCPTFNTKRDCQGLVKQGGHS